MVGSGVLVDAGGLGQCGAGAAGEVDQDRELLAEGGVQGGDGVVDGVEDGDGVTAAADVDPDPAARCCLTVYVSTFAATTSRTPSSSWSMTSRTSATFTVTWSSPVFVRAATDVPPPPRVKTTISARTITTAHTAAMIHSDAAGTLTLSGRVR